MTLQLEEAWRLLRLARRDRETFGLLLPMERASLAALGFHAQQAAEKALKAVATLRGIAAPRTHDLAALGQALLDDGAALPLSVDELRALNPFAAEYRYDDEIIPATTREQLDIQLTAIFAWVEQLVPKSA